MYTKLSSNKKLLHFSILYDAYCSIHYLLWVNGNLVLLGASKKCMYYFDVFVWDVVEYIGYLAAVVIPGVRDAKRQAKIPISAD